MEKKWLEQYALLVEYIALLGPIFSRSNALNEEVHMIADFVQAIFPVKELIVAQVDSRQNMKCDDLVLWRANGEKATAEQIQYISGRMDESLKSLVSVMGETGVLPIEAVCETFELDKTIPTVATFLLYNGKPCGLFLVQKDGVVWEDGQEERILTMCRFLNIHFENRINNKTSSVDMFVFNTVLDNMRTSIYITDPITDKIIYMNRTMREAYNIEVAEGEICWKVLQSDRDSRCSFCPVPELMKKQEGENDFVVQWEELSPINGRFYRNYDSLIPWIDGSIVHLQQSVDFSELKAANIDELTQVLIRRPGKKALQVTLDEAVEKKEVVTVCLYDINMLKEVNDVYGHAEGDRLIQTIMNSIKEILQEDEFAFRLSGDEFVIVFKTGQKSTRNRLDYVIQSLAKDAAGYEVGFCYGLVENSQSHKVSVDEILFLADERMYEQKRQFHILSNKRQIIRREVQDVDAPFVYEEGLLYDVLANSTDDYLFVSNLKTGIFRFTKAMVEEFDLPGEVIEDAANLWGTKIHENDQFAFLESVQEIVDGRATAHCVEYRVKNCKGEWVWVRSVGHVAQDALGEPSVFAGFITNLGEKNKLDQLTGLPNKIAFGDDIEKLIGTDQTEGFAIMVLGIDDLKHINDLYNRTFGDEVIRIISQRIHSLLPNSCAVYRLDGDEFGIIMRDANDVTVEKIYSIIYHTFRSQQEYDGKKYYSTLSAGCLFYPEDADNYLDIMKYADYALEYAKSTGKKRCIFFSKKLLQHRAHTLEMLEELRASVENHCEGFSLRYQPLVCASDGKLKGVEVLARWECPRFGQVSPIEFIPILEKTGLIVPMGKWVVENAIRDYRDWVKAMPELFIDINLSYFQLQEGDFIPFIQEILAGESFAPENLVMELTETCFAQESWLVKDAFKQLRQMGVRVAMDDFGTGYSTLGLLKKSPADIVKVDKTFVRDVQSSSFDATFIRFVVALCHDVGIEVCLEGVETKEEYQAVCEMGLDFIQGYLFDKPLLPEEIQKKYFTEG